MVRELRPDQWPYATDEERAAGWQKPGVDRRRKRRPERRSRPYIYPIDRRAALAASLAQVGIMVENIGSMGNADQYDFDWATTDQLIEELRKRGLVLIESGPSNG